MGGNVGGHFCGMNGRDEAELMNSARRPGIPTMTDWANEAAIKTMEDYQKSRFPVPPMSDSGAAANSAEASTRADDSAGEQCSEGSPGSTEPLRILAAIIGFEKICRGDVERWKERDAGFDKADMHMLIDEPGTRYCLCQSSKNPIVMGLFWIELADITVEDAALAIGKKSERLRWDADSEFDVMRERQSDDPLHMDVTRHVLKAPWPFWDREVVQRRWQMTLPLDDYSFGDGVAFAARSVEADSALPKREKRMPVVVHMAGQLIRPLPAENARTRRSGIELTVCAKMDMGDLAPKWAQRKLGRFAARQARHWAERLRQHCLGMRADYRNSKPSQLPPSGFEMWDRELADQASSSSSSSRPKPQSNLVEAASRNASSASLWNSSHAADDESEEQVAEAAESSDAPSAGARAGHRTVRRPVAHNGSEVQRARDLMAQVDSDVAAIEATGRGFSEVADVLTDRLKQVSDSLDACNVSSGRIPLEERRRDLELLDQLLARVGALRQTEVPHGKDRKTNVTASKLREEAANYSLAACR